ncbi:hypothetical protein ACLOAV_006247 [Pseudogymnoascus australis]
MAQMNTTQGPSNQTPSSVDPAINDQIQQMILKRQNMQRQIDAREEQTRRRQLEAQQAPPISVFEEIHQIDMMIEEADGKRRQFRAYGGGDPDAPHIISMGATVNGGHALEDYQLQLMVLELQNKKRLLIARYEQDSQTTWPGSELFYHGDRPDVE